MFFKIFRPPFDAFRARITKRITVEICILPTSGRSPEFCSGPRKLRTRSFRVQIFNFQCTATVAT